ncbi:MAG: hypothetical protein OHK0029_37770 [Armatimonadaceae bacterium]
MKPTSGKPQTVPPSPVATGGVAVPVPTKGGFPAGAEIAGFPPEAEWVYHFSEEGTIREFVPRPVASNPESEPLVWTIDNAHAWLYFFPRDCPRVAYWALPNTTPQDKERYFADTTARYVVAMESGWLERMQATVLYRYAFRSQEFVSLRDHGCHVTRETVAPASVEPVGDLLTALAARTDVELRITPSLWKLWEGIVSSSLHYSGIRLRNAQPRRGG